jgi:hypothetical protein
MQLTYPLKPARAFAGMHADTFPYGFISRALASRQIEELTFGTTDGTYTVTINGTVVATYVAASKTATEIRDAVKALLDASAAPITTVSSSTNKLLLEKEDDGALFTLAIATVSGYSKSQLVAQAQEVPFGVGLVADDRAAVSGEKCRLPRVATDVTAGRFLGIAASNTSKSPNGGGWPTKSMVDILRTGHIHVLVEGTGTEGANLFMRFASGAGGTQLGAFRADADSTTAVAVPGMRAMETWTASGIVLAELIPNT